MPSDVVNPKVIRERIATLIDAALDDTWDVYNYGTSEFGGKARNVFVVGSGEDYLNNGAGESSVSGADADFDFIISINVLFAKAQQSWTAQQSEDALDLGRKQIADVIRDNRKDANWYRLLRTSPSQIFIVEDQAGEAWRVCSIPVRAEVRI